MHSSGVGEGCKVSRLYTPVPPPPPTPGGEIKGFKDYVTDGTGIVFVNNISLGQFNPPLSCRSCWYWVSGILWYVLYALLPIYRRIFVYNVCVISISNKDSGGATKTLYSSEYWKIIVRLTVPANFSPMCALDNFFCDAIYKTLN